MKFIYQGKNMSTINDIGVKNKKYNTLTGGMFNSFSNISKAS